MAEPTIHVGRSYQRYEGRIDEDATVAFALATNDPNEICRQGRAVPPLYTVSLILPAYMEAQQKAADPGAIRNVRGGMAGGHDVHIINPLRAGMEVSWQATTYNARQTAKGAVVTQRIVVSDREGAPLVEHFWWSFLIGGEIDEDVGPDLADHRFPAGVRERIVATHTIEVARDQGFRFAGVSGDHNPHSMDDEAARREGFPGKILQGMCTFAMCGGAIVKVGAGGDPNRLRRLAGRFSAPVFPGRPIVVHAYDASEGEQGRRILAFEATQDARTVLEHGRAELSA